MKLHIDDIALAGKNVDQVSLVDLMNLLCDIEKRLVRIETRLVRSFLSDGLDVSGNP